jgi:hypothetical protein
VYYYECKIVASGPEGYMSLGWVLAGVHTGRLVGWDIGSWGWHADDGRCFEGSGMGRAFGEGWGGKFCFPSLVGLGVPLDQVEASRSGGFPARRIT